MRESSRIRRRVLATVAVLGMLVASLVLVGGVAAEGAPFPEVPGSPFEACAGMVSGGTGMYGGTGVIMVDVPGPVRLAYLVWAGADWGDAANINVNGVPVAGTLDDTVPTIVSQNDWLVYRADVTTLVSEGLNTLNIDGWEPPTPPYWDRRNGASLFVVYDRGAGCTDPVLYSLFNGGDWYYEGSAGELFSDVHAYGIFPAPFDRTIKFAFSYAGADYADGPCHHNRIYYWAGNGAAPAALAQSVWPESTAINGAALIAHDLISPSVACIPEIFPPATAWSGGFIDYQWSQVTLEVTVPAGADLIAFQMESPNFLDATDVFGESGAWVGTLLEQPLPVPDVTISKENGIDIASPGDVLTYDIEYFNQGTRDAENVQIVDTLPAFSTYLGCDAGPGSCSEAGGQVTFDLATVAAGTGGTVTVTVQLDPLFVCGDTPISNMATISTTTIGDDLTNNDAEDSDIVNAWVAVDIEKSVAPEPVDAGGTLEYTLNWWVDGNCWAENTTLWDMVPANTAFVGATGAYDGGTNTVTWAFGQVAPSAAGTETLTVAVDTCLYDGTIIDNTAYMSEDYGSTDESTTYSTVAADHVLAIDKVSDPSPVMKNDPLTYDIVWEITGNEPADNVVITDEVPDGTVFDSATGGGIYDPVTNMITWNLGNFCPPAGGHVSFTVIVDRNLADPAEISNLAVICDDDPGTACAEDREITPVIWTSEIGEFVWYDIDGDAVQDAGEPGMGGVILNLYDAGPDALCNTGDETWLDTRTTDASGWYLFDLLLTGNYCVWVDGATAMADTYLSPASANPHGPIALDPPSDPDEQYLDADFGFYPGGSIGDYVWLDLDGDAVQDAGEAGMAGVVVNMLEPGADGVCGTGDDVVFNSGYTSSMTTDAAGMYLFDPIPSRDFCVDVDESTLLADVYFSPGQVEPHPVALAPFEDYLDADFGYYPGGSIGDFVWLDLNGDAVQDPGEPGIEGADVWLDDAGPDGLCQTGDDFNFDVTTTDVDGLYLFDPIPSRNYCVHVDEGTLPADVYFSPGQARPHEVALAPWEDYLDADFGYFPGGSIGDYVWLDLDGDAVQDAGEAGIAGVVVNMLEPGADGVCGTGDDVVFNSGYTSSMTTDAAGMYLFDPIPSRDYCVDIDESTLPADVYLSPGQVEPHPVALAPFEDYLDADFGYYPGGSIGDFVWLDLNGDAVQDAGELGIPDVTVNLYTAAGGTCDAYDAMVGSTVTDADGLYIFDPLPMGMYCVDVDESTLPADVFLSPGSTEPHGPVDLGPGEDYVDADFGYYPGGSIGDLVWLDRNGDGILSGTEPGMEGVTVDLLADGGDGICDGVDDMWLATAITDADGLYLFDPLPIGVYCVAVDEATLLNDVYPSPGTVNPYGPIALGAWEDYVDADFGYFPGGSIGNVVWWDTNADGTRQLGEEGIPLVRVNLLDPGLDGACDEFDMVLDSQLTGFLLKGLYRFDPLPAGMYCVDVVDSTLPEDVFLSPSMTDPHGPIILLPWQNYWRADFGYYEGGSVGDFVWQDSNGDAVQDAGEPGIADVGVSLLDPGVDGLCATGDDLALDAATTDAGGMYLFDVLPLGMYCVDVDEATLPADVFLSPGVAEPHGPIDLGPSEDYLDADFGYYPGGSIGDFVWLDLNGDFVQDAGEPGIAGAGVELYGAGDDDACGTVDDIMLDAAITDADGMYLFDPLPIGDYCVVVDEATLPADVYPSPGTVNPYGPIALGPWQDFVDADFGYYPGGSIGDFVWLDLNGDAVQDAGEAGIAGVGVALYDAGADGLCDSADDVMFDSMVTDAGGMYLFDPLPIRNYCVDIDEATLPADVYLSPGQMEPYGPIALAANEDYLDADFGYYPGGSIGDFVWLDYDGDAVQDAGEPGIAGVGVDLYDAGADGLCDTVDDEMFNSMTTDAGGMYLFDPLPMRNYCVDIDEGTLPADVYLSPGQMEPYGPIALAANEDFADADFGYFPGGSIGDYVWMDDNGDGVQDAGEAGIFGAALDLIDAGADGLCGTADDTVFASITTSTSGMYLFDPIPVRTYCVELDESTLPADVYISPGITNPHGPVALAAWQDYADADFGYFPGGSIGDFVWFDENRDGLQDGEAGIAGVVVDLHEPGADGVCGTADDVFWGTDTTDAAGMYGFDPLPVRDYCAIVDETTLATGLNLTFGAVNPYGPVALGAWEDYLDADFGYAYPEIVIVKEASGEYIHRHEDMSFTLTVDNLGPGSANDVVVTDVISEYLYYIRLDTTQGTAVWNSGTSTVTVSLGTLGEGEQAVVTITGRVVDIPTADLPKTIYDTATVDFAGNPDPIDSNETVTEIVYFFPGEVPEPSTMVLMGSGLLGLAGYARLHVRRRKSRK